MQAVRAGLVQEAIGLLACAAVLAGVLPSPALGSGGPPFGPDLARVTGDLSFVRSRQEELAQELTRLEVEAAGLNWEMTWNRRKAAAIVRLLYETGRMGLVDYLLSSESISDLAYRAAILRCLAEQAADLCQKAKLAETKLASRREQVEEMRGRLEEIESLLQDRKQALGDALRREAALSQAFGPVLASWQAAAALPGWKLEMGRPVAGLVTSPFGMRIHPIARVQEFHDGLDLAAGEGDPVMAAEGGLVLFSGELGGYGNLVVVDHGGGVATVYAHLSRQMVRAGQTVSRGQVVGLVGTTGVSTGPHLHFEVRLWGKPDDPARWLSVKEVEGAVR